MYVGLDVYTLCADDEITEYDAAEGGGRTPFSIGFGIDNIYFLTEHMVISYDEMLRYLRGLPGRGAEDVEVTQKWLRGLDPTALYRHAYAMQSKDEYSVHQMNIIGTMLG